MVRRTSHAVLLAVTVAVSSLLTAAISATVKRADLAGLTATRMGVDGAGNLWAWDATRRLVTRVNGRGDRTESERLPDASSVDADAARGIALLDPHGRTVQVFSWDGRIVHTIALQNAAGDVAWLDEGRLAVTPRFAGHRVEIVDPATSRVLATVGPCPPVAAGRGATPARATHVRHDHKRAEIVTLDALRGDLVVFARDGSVVRKAMLRSEGAAEIDRWIAEQDARAKAAGEVFTPLFWHYASVAITGDGTIWAADKANKDGSVAFFRVDRGGAVTRQTIPMRDCPSVRVVSWQEHLVFHRDPRSSQPQCVGIWRSQ